MIYWRHGRNAFSGPATISTHTLSNHEHIGIRLLFNTRPNHNGGFLSAILHAASRLMEISAKSTAHQKLSKLFACAIF